MVFFSLTAIYEEKKKMERDKIISSCLLNNKYFLFVFKYIFLNIIEFYEIFFSETVHLILKMLHTVVRDNNTFRSKLKSTCHVFDLISNLRLFPNIISEAV